MSKKQATFQQVMKAKEALIKAKHNMYRAEEKYEKLVKLFPECVNQLFKYNEKLYVVSNVSSLWNENKIKIDEINTAEDK